MPQRELDLSVLRFLDEEDSRYLIGDWLPQFQAWDQQGVYTGLTQWLKLEEGDHHLDLGCGIGALACEARKTYPNTVIWGVDRTRMALLIAAEAATEDGVATEIHAYGGVLPDSETGTVSPIFMRDEARLAQMHPFQLGGPVQLIMDDLRTMGVVTSILGERKIDSASFIFPGFGMRSAYEFPNKIPENAPDLTQQIANVRMSQYIQLVRKMALFFATEVVKEGGQLVVAERGATDDPSGIVVALHEQLARTGLIDYWEMEEVAPLGSIARTDGREAWSHIDASGEYHSGSVSFASAIRLRRKPDPNVEELKEYARYRPRQKTAREVLLDAARRLFGRG